MRGTARASFFGSFNLHEACGKEESGAERRQRQRAERAETNGEDNSAPASIALVGPDARALISGGDRIAEMRADHSLYCTRIYAYTSAGPERWPT